MANVSLIRGGTPVIRYMWHERDYTQFQPPYGLPNIPFTPPYDAHVDGAYGSGLAYFTLGMPVVPNGVGMEWQRKALMDQNPQVDDFIDLIVVPEDHFVTFINFKIMQSDPRMAGATVALAARTVEYNEDGELVYTEIDDVEEAVAAQGITSPIPVDKPYNAFVSLLKIGGSSLTGSVTGTVSDSNVTGTISSGEASGYVMPLYSKPYKPAADADGSPVAGKTVILGVKIVAMPTDNKVSWHMMRNGWYFSAKIQGFECPTYY